MLKKQQLNENNIKENNIIKLTMFRLFRERVTPSGLPVGTKVHCSFDVTDSLVVIGTLI